MISDFLDDANDIADLHRTRIQRLEHGFELLDRVRNQSDFIRRRTNLAREFAGRIARIARHLLSIAGRLGDMGHTDRHFLDGRRCRRGGIRLLRRTRADIVGGLADALDTVQQASGIAFHFADHVVQ